jgi:hypothetical protein
MFQERIMPTRARLLSLMLAVATLILVACGGDDSKAEEKTRDSQTATPAAAAAATSAPTSSTSGSARASGTPSTGSSQTLQLNCDDVRAFRFNGKLSLDAPHSGSGSGDINSLIASLLRDVAVSGAYVAPDRTQFKAEGGANSPIGTIEVIQIGNTVYTQLGSTGWQQSTGEGNPLDFVQDFEPRQLCSGLGQRLPADVPTRKERVNGVDATRYEYDRAALERLNDDLLDELDPEDDPIPDNVKLTIWVADKEKFPVKIALTGTGEQDGQPAGLNLELNVTDLNGNVQIEAPR